MEKAKLRLDFGHHSVPVPCWPRSSQADVSVETACGWSELVTWVAALATSSLSVQKKKSLHFFAALNNLKSDFEIVRVHLSAAIVVAFCVLVRRTSSPSEFPVVITTAESESANPPPPAATFPCVGVGTVTK